MPITRAITRRKDGNNNSIEYDKRNRKELKKTHVLKSKQECRRISYDEISYIVEVYKYLGSSYGLNIKSRFIVLKKCAEKIEKKKSQLVFTIRCRKRDLKPNYILYSKKYL